MTLPQHIIDLEFQLGTGDFGTGGADTVKLSGLRVSASISKLGLNPYTELSLKAWGMPLSVMNKLTVLNKVAFPDQRNNTVTVKAGDQDTGTSVVFVGAIQEAWADGRNAPDVMFHLVAQNAGFTLAKPVPPTSYRGSVDVATMLAGLATSAGLGFENGGVTAQISNAYYGGDLKAQVEAICQDVGCMWTVDTVNGILAIWPEDGKRNGAIVKVSPSTGMVGYPAFTQQGVQVMMAYNPSISFGHAIQIESDFTPANGKWVVAAIQHYLDANLPGGQWFTEVECGYLGHSA